MFLPAQLRLPQISCFTLSLKCFSSDSDSCPDVGIGPLLQFPHPPRAGPVLLTLLFAPLVLFGSIYSFPLVRYSCLFSAGVLYALLCLKVYSWCIRGEICTPRPPTPPPSCSSPCVIFYYYNCCFCLLCYTFVKSNSRSRMEFINLLPFYNHLELNPNNDNNNKSRQ